MSSAVVLSDVHIGDNSVTNWYQEKVHAPYLVKTLEWVADNAGSISDLVLLGDLVDFWTYPPEDTPPTMSKIIDANASVLGPGGALAKAAKAIAGRSGHVTLLPGNHDITLTAADAATLSKAIGVDVAFHTDEALELTGANGRKTSFVHGHYFTMFNAPDATTNLAPMPVGHFVTRIIAWKMKHKVLKGDQTVADLHLWGQPSPDFSTVIAAIADGRANIAAVLLDLFAIDAGLSDRTPVTLPGGNQITIADAKTAFANLLLNWLRRWPPQDVVRAAMADYTGDVYLAWFAQWFAMKHTADLVVAGHTHQPIGGLRASPVAYVNNGYTCPAIPDLKSGEASFTFTVVDLDTAAAAMHKVAPDGHGGFAVGDFQGPISGIVSSGLYDLSSYVRLSNQVGQDIACNVPVPVPGHGRWVIEPPARMANGQTAWIWLQDNPGTFGSLGSFSYDGRFRYDVACPTGTGDNVAGGPGADFAARAGDYGKSWRAWQGKGQVPLKGYPLQVDFTLAPADTDPNFTGRCGENSSARSALGLQPGASMKLNGSTALNGCMQGNDRACIYGITLSEAAPGHYYLGIYRYRLSIDGQGPSGFSSGSFYLAFTDQTGDVYKKSFFWSKRQTLTLDYNSDSPTIVKVQWSNTAI
jgi:UDP-2,3-diacylglucosamine pyrophosphatase LpxH